VFQKWHSGLAKAAQRWADRCLGLVHDNATGLYLDGFGQSGQNIFISTGRTLWWDIIKSCLLLVSKFALQSVYLYKCTPRAPDFIPKTCGGPSAMDAPLITLLYRLHYLHIKDNFLRRYHPGWLLILDAKRSWILCFNCKLQSDFKRSRKPSENLALRYWKGILLIVIDSLVSKARIRLRRQTIRGEHSVDFAIQTRGCTNITGRGCFTLHADNSPRPQIEIAPSESFVGMLQELPHQNVVHGVQGLQVRAQYDEWDPRDRPLHAGGVGDDTSGRMRGEPLHRRQGSARQGFLYVRLQLRSEVGIMLNNWRTVSIASWVKRIEFLITLRLKIKEPSYACIKCSLRLKEKSFEYTTFWMFFFSSWEKF